MRNGALLAAALALAACGRGAPPGDARPNHSFKLTTVAEHLAAPVALADPNDGSGRLFVAEQGGTVRIVRGGAGGAVERPFLRLAGDGVPKPPLGFTNAGSEQGLLGLAFHPKFAENGTFFVDYTDGDGDVVVARYRVSSRDAGVADHDSGSVVLHVQKDFANHNGGAIVFGPDGYLYVGIGDGGGAGNPCGRARTLDPADLRDDGPCAAHEHFVADGGNPNARALQGKILRIDVDAKSLAGAQGLCAAKSDGTAAYGIPSDNPFGGAGDGARGCDEVWASGLRNPWRFSFDRETGALFIGDVGQDRVEEIDFAPPRAGGRDYGWSLCEGDAGFAGATCPSDTSGMSRPILSYAHGRGDCSVIGGYRYRGPIEKLRGRYVFGDYCSGRVFVATEQGGRWTHALALRADARITSFGEDAQGNLYLVDGGAPGSVSGRILRFDPP